MAIKTMKLACDFETTTDPNDVRVWASCAVDIETLETAFIGNSIDSFFEWLKDKNTVCYFHNLKFDGEFILSYLLRSGYKHVEEPKEPKTFGTLITDNGIFYSITVIFDKLNKKYKKVVFYDSLKKLPLKVSQIAKAFQLVDQKLSIDYHEYRRVGHELTEQEREYIVHDCRIVANALQIQFSRGLKKMTNASDAMSGFKEIIDKKNFERWFPVLPVELDDGLRKAYKGGFTYLKPVHKERRGLKGLTLDVNSLYPSVMYSKPLPYGYPMYFEGEPEDNETFPLFIVHVRCSFKLKKDHIPTIQLKNNFRFIPTDYLSSSDGEEVSLYLTNVDLELFLDHYDVENNITYVCGWRFRAVTGVFKEYIDYWMRVKETSTGAMRQLAKLMLNSLYGKFATNPHAFKKCPKLDEEEVVRYEIPRDDHGKRIEDTRDPVYTAMGAFITAYAREKTIRSAQAVYDRFIYADTDSLHLIGYDMPEGLEIHPTHLGAWKHEGYFSDSKYIRAKTYMETMGAPHGGTLRVYAAWSNERNDTVLKTFCDYVYKGKKGEKTVVTCAGMPDNVKKAVTYENFTSGSTFDGKLMPRRFKGGVVLTETTFTIK